MTDRRLSRTLRLLRRARRDPRLRLWLARDRWRLPARADLTGWAARHMKRIIPYRRICPGHSAPIEFLDHMLYGSEDCLGHACRSGGKTMQTGVVCGMDAYPFKLIPKDMKRRPGRGLEVRELAGSADQGDRVYQEFTKTFLEAGFGDQIVEGPLKKSTRLAGGGAVAILQQSETSVRGPHVPRLRLDEIDEFDEGVFSSALSIPKAQGGTPSMVSMASTFHKPFGLMSKQLEEFKGKVFVWCIFEIMRRCDFKCQECNLAKYCPGPLKMQGAVGYVPVAEARKQRARILDDEVFESDVLCRRPRTEGQVYPRLDRRLHMPAILDYEPGMPVFISWDYGTDHPTVCQWWQLSEVEGRWQARCIDEMRWRGKAPSVIVKDFDNYMHEMNYISWYENIYVPADAAGFRAELENAGYSTSMPDQDVEAGIGTVRNLLVPDINGTVGLLLDARECRETFKEMSLYHMKNGKVVKDKDDGPDAVRYFVHSRPELKAAGRVAMELLDVPLLDGGSVDLLDL